MRVTTLAGYVSEQRLVLGQSQYFLGLDLDFVPLEDQHAPGAKNAEALGKATGQVIPPVVGKNSVLGPEPGLRPSLAEMRRIEDDKLEAIVIKWHIAKIHNHVRLDAQRPAVAKDVFLTTDIAEQHSLIVPVEPKHPAAAAWVEDRSQARG